MKIIGAEGISGKRLSYEIQNGAKFVIYEYCISILVMTFKRPSNIYFIKAGDGAISKGLKFSLISLLFGWWGIPWGPIYTVNSIVTNFRGGQDVTQAILTNLKQDVT